MSNQQMKKDQGTISGVPPYRHVNHLGEIKPLLFESVPDYVSLNWSNLPGTIQSAIVGEQCFLKYTSVIKEAIKRFRKNYSKMLSLREFPMLWILNSNDDKTIAEILYLALFPYFYQQHHDLPRIEFRALTKQRLFMDIPDALNQFFQNRSYSSTFPYALHRISITPLLLTAIHALEDSLTVGSFFNYEDFPHGCNRIPTAEFLMIEYLATEIRQMTIQSEKQEMEHRRQLQAASQPVNLWNQQAAAHQPFVYDRWGRVSKFVPNAGFVPDPGFLSPSQLRPMPPHTFTPDLKQQDNPGHFSGQFSFPSDPFNPQWPRGYKDPDPHSEASLNLERIEKRFQELNTRCERIEKQLAAFPLSQKPVYDHSSVATGSPQVESPGPTATEQGQRPLEEQTNRFSDFIAQGIRKLP